MSGVGIGRTLDDRTQTLIDANLAEAQALVSSEEEWEWDAAVFQTHMQLQLGDNLNEAEMNSAPYLPGLSAPREYESEEAMLMRNKDWIMKFSDIRSDEEFEKIKKETMLRFENFKELQARERIKRGESPITNDFMAERRLLADEVSAVGEDNPLHAFAQKALDTLDGNSGWSYDKKIKALKVLMKNAEKYNPSDEQMGEKQ